MAIHLFSIAQFKQGLDAITQKNDLAIINQIVTRLKAVYEADTLSSRLIALEDLVKTCTEQSKQLLDHYTNKKMIQPEARLLAQISTLQAQALYFLKAILGVRSNAELTEKLEDYKKNKSNAPKHIPSQNFLHKAALNDRFYISEHYRHLDKTEGTRYLKDMASREPYRVLLHKGKFKQLEVQGLKEDQKTLTLSPFISKALKNKNERDLALLSMDKYGNMYTGITLQGKFHHSSLLGGKSAFFAGLIETNNKGALVKLSNASGHYQTNVKGCKNFLYFLAEHGALDSCVSLELVHNVNKEKIDVEKIQSDVRDKHHHLTTMSYKEWREKTRQGFFHLRSSLSQLDALLLKYFKTLPIRSTAENIEFIDKIVAQINAQKQKRPSAKIAAALAKLAEELQQDKTYFQQQLSQKNPTQTHR